MPRFDFDNGAWCQKLPCADAANEVAIVRLFDHLVGGGDERRRHREAKNPGGLVIDDQLESGRLLDSKLGGR
jgi:hypothetical protein